MHDDEIMSKVAQNNYFSYDYEKSNYTDISRYILSSLRDYMMICPKKYLPECWL